MSSIQDLQCLVYGKLSICMAASELSLNSVEINRELMLQLLQFLLAWETMMLVQLNSCSRYSLAANW